MRKRSLVMGIVLLVTCLVVSSFSGVLAAKKYKISVIFKALNSDWWKTVQAGVMAGAKDFNADVTVLGPQAETAVQEQFDMIQSQITKNIDALAVAPLRPATTVTAFDQAKAAGIPVIVFDTKANWPDQVTFIGLGNYAIAKELGKYIKTKALRRGGNMVIIRGAMGDQTHEERVKGVLDVIKGSKIKVLATQAANSERGLAMNVMQNLLQANSNIKLVYATNDEMALGALRALEGANLVGKVKVIGWDGTPDALASIRGGKLTASVDGNAYGMGYDVVKNTVNYLKGQKLAKNIPIQSTVIDKTNYPKYIKRLSKALNRKI
jgi:ribose transport system substrate-binding protein